MTIASDIGLILNRYGIPFLVFLLGCLGYWRLKKWIQKKVRKDEG